MENNSESTLDTDAVAAAMRAEAEKSIAHAYEAAADFMKELASEK